MHPLYMPDLPFASNPIFYDRKNTAPVYYAERFLSATLLRSSQRKKKKSLKIKDFFLLAPI